MLKNVLTNLQLYNILILERNQNVIRDEIKDARSYKIFWSGTVKGNVFRRLGDGGMKGRNEFETGGSPSDDATTGGDKNPQRKNERSLGKGDDSMDKKFRIRKKLSFVFNFS